MYAYYGLRFITSESRESSASAMLRLYAPDLWLFNFSFQNSITELLSLKSTYLLLIKLEKINGHPLFVCILYDRFGRIFLK